VALKNVSINEPFFRRHFPSSRCSPACCSWRQAQLAGLLLLRKLENTGSWCPVVDRQGQAARVGRAGDQLRIEVETLRMKGETAQVRGVGTVSGKLVCEATLMFTMLEP